MNNNNNTSSSSTSSNSFYVTPMTSPINSPQNSQYSLESTSMDFSISLDAPSVVQMESHALTSTSHTQACPASRSSTTSTLKAQSPLDNPIVLGMSQTHGNTFMSNPRDVLQNLLDNNNSQSHHKRENDLILRYLVDTMDHEHAQMVSLEENMQMLSLQCKSMRDNLANIKTSKSSLIMTLVTHLMNTPTKNDAQTQTVVSQVESQSLPQTPNKNGIKDTHQSSIRAKLHGGQSYIPTASPMHSSNGQASSPSFSNLSQNGTQRKSQKIIDIPISSSMQSKLSRLPAMVKGYLVRRLVKTEKVQDTIKTIRDTTQELINLNLELPEREVTQEDVSLHSRLIAQLESACRRYYDIFMNCSKKEQMNMIANSRNFMMERQFRSNSKPSTPSLSSVSKRTLERKVTDSKVRKSSSSSAAAVSSARRNDKMRSRIEMSPDCTPTSSRSQNMSGSDCAVLRRSQRTNSRIKADKRSPKK